MSMTREEMNDKMVELLEATESTDGAVVFNGRAAELVKELATWARGTDFYKENHETATKFFDSSATPSEIWMFMLQRIVGAPTSIHRDCVVAGHMPALENAITRQAGQ